MEESSALHARCHRVVWHYADTLIPCESLASGSPLFPHLLDTYARYDSGSRTVEAEFSHTVLSCTFVLCGDHASPHTKRPTGHFCWLPVRDRVESSSREKMAVRIIDLPGRRNHDYYLA